MKKFAFAICLLFAITICAHAKTPPNPADYTITVHVTGSHIAFHGMDVEFLDVTIDGQRYELRCAQMATDLLRPGDYKARISKDEHDRPYEFLRIYELLLTNNKTRQFQVVGIPDPMLPPSTH